MTHRWLIYVALILLFSANNFLAGKDREIMNQKKALIDLENRWLAAEDNPDALESILADDFIHVLPMGFVTKAEQLSYQRAHPAPEQETRKFEDLRIRIYGSVGIANGIVVATNSDGKIHKTIFTDIFAYRDHKWQAVNAQELPLNKEKTP